MKPAEGSTIIGKSVVIRGEVSGTEDFYLDGELHGTVSLPDSRLTVGPNARVEADLNVRDAVILGRVNGNIRATGRLELRHSAVVNGDLFVGKISIEESAIFKGRVDLSQDAARTPATSDAGATTPIFTAPKSQG